MPDLPSYVVISPVKDEAQHFARTAEALIGQTHQPREWVVVDDGSTDATLEIASRYAAQYKWIKVIQSRGSGRRERGTPIVQAFKHGLEHSQQRAEFVVKLDGDLFFSSNYFAWVAATFQVDPRAGIVGGIVFINQNGRWAYDQVSHRTVHGAIKSYRCSCLEDIGGLHESMGWDGIDEFGARARDWNVHVLSELAVLHYKARGSAQPWLRARWEEGRGAHYMGYRVSALGMRAGYRMLVEYPPFVGGLVLAAGFCWYSLRRAPQADILARNQLRSEQKGALQRRIFHRKSAPSLLPGGGPAYWLTGDNLQLPAVGSMSRPAGMDVANNPGRGPHCETPIGDVTCDDAASSDHDIVADGNAG